MHDGRVPRWTNRRSLRWPQLPTAFACALAVLLAGSLIAGCGASDATSGLGSSGGTGNQVADGWNDQSVATDGGFLDVVFVDQLHGWAVGWHGNRVTDDGGLTWRDTEVGSTVALAVAAVDPRHAWILKADDVMFTEDGGDTWVNQKPPVQRYDTGGLPEWDEFADVEFSDADHGWVVGEGGTILVTNDGGRHWDRQAVDQFSGVFFQSVSFVDAMHGWAASSDGVLAATSDGGETWDTIAQESLYRVEFVDVTHGWGVQGGSLFATTDGGRTWSEQVAASDVGVSLRQVAFVDTHNGWAVGDNGDDDYPFGKILRTVDGGRTWTQTYMGEVLLNGVALVDKDHGWVVGSDAFIMATGNGGIADPASPGPRGIVDEVTGD